ncbi:MAG TPA: SPW repeat protein [Candidatus Saccharimonadales bacterium]|nr:SPW repeat protein [Candidatus Saccharimonadales bacterium]
MEDSREETTIENRNSIQSMSIINLILAAWLIVSPWILSYVSGAKWNQVILGVAIGIFSLIRIFAPSQQWASALNGVAGLWLIIAPFILSFTKSAAYWNEIIVGIVIAWIAFSNAAMRYGGHHLHHGSA